MHNEKITRVKAVKKLITPALIINISTLRNVSIWQLKQSDKSLDYYENIFKEVVEFEWSNNHQYFSNINGMLFIFRLSQTEIKVWDTKSNLVFKATFPDAYEAGRAFKGDRPNYDATIPREVFNEMEATVDMYAAGQIKCSKCGVPVVFSEVAGTFYAGSYCATCWESGVKQAEANEKYD